MAKPRLTEMALPRVPVIRRLELNVKNTQRKRRFLLVIPTFIIFVLIVVLGRNVHDSYLLEESFKETVLHEEVEGGVRFEEVRTFDEIFLYIEKTFVPFFYEENNYDGTPLPDFAKGTVLGVNKIVGGFRLIQRRVKEGTCDKVKRYEEILPECWGPLTDENTQTEPFKPSGHAEAETYEYEDEGHGVSGYFVDFGLDRAETEAKLAQLKRDRFIDLGTREIDLDFTLYNHNINQVLVGRVLFRISQASLVTPEADLHSLRLEPYETSLDKFRLALEIIFLTITSFGFMWEVWRVVRRALAGRPVVSWWFGWPLVRMLNIALSFAAMGLWYRYFNDPLRRDYKLPPTEEDGFIDLEKLAIELQEFLLVSAVNIFVFILLTLEAVRFSDKASFITEVFSRSAEKLVAFLTLFMFVYCSFALSGHMLFGVSLKTWSTFGSSFTTLYELTTGEAAYQDLLDANPAAPVFYYAFIVLIFFMLFNVFIAILADGYIALSEEKRAHLIATNNYSVPDFWREYARNVTGREPWFKSSTAYDLLRDASFKDYNDVAYVHAMRVAKIRGVSPALVRQMYRRYGIVNVDLVKMSQEKVKGSPRSVHAAVKAEFESAVETGKKRFDTAELKVLQRRVLSVIDGGPGGGSDSSDEFESFGSDASSYSYDSA